MNNRPLSAAAWHAGGVRYGVRQAGEAPRWARCVEHRNTEVERFAALHFGDDSRRVLLVGGAGFDPRSLVVARLLATVASGRVDGVFLRERRPNPDPVLLSRADAHIQRLQEIVGPARVIDINVFEEDGAVGLGRHAVRALQYQDLSIYTDVVIDFSALSIGSSFPIARLLLQRIETESAEGRHAPNLHALVTASPTTDDSIVPDPSAVVQPVHGFQGRFGIDETARAARLWMPQLRFHQRGVLDRLYEEIKPDDVVPVLPFPAQDPRVGDRLIDHYTEEFDGRWAVDARSIVYADEGSPLDFYRTVLRIDDGRRPVFESTGGSLLILSPVGSKVLALGAMMAAVERDFPVIYVEALSYTAHIQDSHDQDFNVANLVHVWLLGEAYPPPAGRSGQPSDHAV